MAIIMSVAFALLCFAGAAVLLRKDCFETDRVEDMRETVQGSPYATVAVFALGMPAGLGAIYLLATYVGSFLFALQVLAFSMACGYLVGAFYGRPGGYAAFLVTATLYALWPTVLLHNLLGIGAVLFAVVAFAQVIHPTFLFLLCVGLSAYDIVAVHQLGMMQETVKKAADAQFIPAFLFPIEWAGYLQPVSSYVPDLQGVLLIGFGDYIFAVALGLTPLYPSLDEPWKYRWSYVVCLIIGTLAGLYGSGFATMLPFFEHGVAALPFVTAGALVGLGIGWLLERFIYA